MLESAVLTYVAEISVPKIRGSLSATGSTCVILGVLSQFFMGTLLDWRTITLVSSCVPIIAIILLSFVPESPHWLIQKNRKEEAQRSLMWLRGWEKSFDNVRSEFENLEKNLNESKASAAGRCKIVFEEFSKRSFILPYFIIFFSFFVGHFSGMTTLQTYSVAIFEYFNTPMDKFYATTLLGTLELTGTIFCVIFVRFIGKRKLSFISMIGCGLCFFSTAIYAFNFTDDLSNSFFHEKISRELLKNTTEFSHNISTNETATVASVSTEHTTYSWIPLTLLLTSALLSHSGIRLLPWILIGEGKEHSQFDCLELMSRF
jgi:MFS family permease